MLDHIPLIMGLISFAGGAATWYGAAVKKNYASERDFNHLKRNYEGLNSNVAALSDLIDNRLDQIALTMQKIETRQEIILNQRTSKEDL